MNAARKLLNAKKWPTLEHDAEHRLLWGACQGSGASAYRVAVEVEDLGAKCSCPSRKFPCKHAVALMWWLAEQPQMFSEGTVPEWVTEWQGRRRRGSTPARKEQEAAPKSARAAKAVVPEPAKDGERSKRQRERTRDAREASIRKGLDELDLWICDQLERGLAAFGAKAMEQCKVLAKRLVDAKAGGLASQVETLPSRYFQTPETHRYDVLVETLGGLHLLAEAYRRQESLSVDLRAEVRARIGWVQSREELLAAKDAKRIEATWTVLAVLRETQPDRLIRYESYLACPADAGLQFAVLLDFVPTAAAAGSAPSLEPGTRIDAELVFYPSPTPVRAQIVRQSSPTRATSAPELDRDLRAALDEFDAQLARNPWLVSWPLAFAGVRVAQDARGAWWAVDQAGSGAVALSGDEASPLAGLENVSLYGTFDGRSLTPLSANTEIGSWWNSL